MKKFLTVLLALSVVFTYSFSAVGTAFADTEATEKTYSAEDVEYELNRVVSAYEKDMTGDIDRVVEKLIHDDADYTVEVKAKAIENAAAEFIKNLIEEMNEVVEDEVTKADKADYSADDLAAAKTKLEALITEDAYYNYTEAIVEPVAQSTEGLVVMSGSYWIPATTKYVVADTNYYKMTTVPYDIVSSNVKSYFIWNANENRYQVPSDSTASQDVTYYAPAQVPADSLVYGFEFTSDSTYYTDKEGTVATGYAQPETVYYTRTEIAATDLTDYNDFADALKASGLIEKAEAPLAEAYYTEKVEEDYPLSNYPADGAYEYDGVKNLTGQEVVDAIKADALEAISEAAKALKAIKTPTTTDYQTAIEAYEEAYNGIATAITKAGVPTNEELEDGELALDAAIQLEIAKLKAYAVGTFTGHIWGGKADTPTGTNTINLNDTWLDHFDKDIYNKDDGSNSATIFGVEVKDITKATRAEVLAVKAAYNKAILETVDAVEAAVKASDIKTAEDLTEEMSKYYTASEDSKDIGTFVKTVNKAYGVSDKYDAVIARGDALKAAVKAGEKLYDDAKVDSVVAVAADAVYADMGAKSVDKYFLDAINEVFDTNYTTYSDALAELLLPGDFEYDKLTAAIKEAQEKFQDRVVTIGSNATPEADKKYCRNYYAVNETNGENETYGDLYDEIKADTLNALGEAQSYADIDAAMADADAELAKLMLAADASAVKAARESRCDALEDYAEEVQDLKGTTDYAAGTYDAAVVAGKKLINNAVTVDGVDAAYEEAKALFDTLKTDDELDALKEEIEETLKALPLASKVTAADADAIEAAREAYDAYTETIGADNISITAENRLKNAENALYTLEAKALTAEVKDMADKLGKIDFASEDVAVAELLALKDDMTALADKVEAFNQKMEDKDIDIKVDADAIAEALDLAEGTVWDAEVYMTEMAILKVLKDDAVNMSDINAAFDAYKALTDRQQYKVDKDTNYAVEAVKAKIINAVESLKITASSTAAKGSITVKWKVVGDYDAADGMRVYKSTKMNSGYGATPYFITKKGATQYKNTKELKKGTRYYYKVRAYVEIDGVKYYSDYSNKAYRIAK